MDNHIKDSICNLMESCVVGIEYLTGKICDCEDEVLAMLADIMQAVACVDQSIEKNNFKELQTAQKYCKNIIYSIQDVLNGRRLLENTFFWEIYPMVYELKRNVNFVIQVLQNRDAWEKYRCERKNIYKDIPKVTSERYKYKVSIILIAYNQLEYTKKAVESIYKHTDFSTGLVELITVDNGSSDGTWEYFNTLPNLKKIHLQHNILGNTIHHYSTEGEYIVGFSNDVIATPRWLDNLLRCIESDERIFWVVPTCNASGISNNQGIPTAYQNAFSEIPVMEEFAEGYNHSDPSKWEERSLLMPFICLARKKWMRNGDGLDLLYTQSEFSDDDFSTALRRGGFKQLLAKDTFMHHFGSVSLREGQKANNSLNNMRKVYFDKWGVDAWESRAIFLGIEACLEKLPLRNVKTALFLEPLFGGSFLQVKNFCRKKGFEISDAEAIVIDERYIDDAKGLFKKVRVGSAIMELLNDIQGAFDIISAGRFLAELESSEILNLLETLYKKLKKGGMMVLPIQNYRNTSVILQFLLNGSIESYSRPFNEFSGCSIDKIKQALDAHPYLCNYNIVMCGNAGPTMALTEKLIEFINTNVGEIHNTDQERFRSELNSIYGFLCIGK